MAREGKIAELEVKINRVLTAETKIQKDHSKLITLLGATDLEQFSVLTDNLNERLLYLSNRLEKAIHRECVVTEASFYVRQNADTDFILDFHICLMKALDIGDDFFEFGGSRSLTVIQWVDKIKSLHGKYDIEDSGIASGLVNSPMPGSI